ncbi:amidase [Oceanobacillus sp. CAU 1775]
MKTEEYLQLDAVAMSDLLKKKEVTPKELTLLALEQLEKVQPTLNLATSIRKEKVLAEAEKINVMDSPFAGVPTMLKNVSQTLPGEKMTSGSKILKDNIATIESNFVKRLRESGFLFLGHTNTPEFALKNITEPALYGPTRNPWNVEHSPGGSSGGAAAAIASGVSPVAGASDGGGSIRIPASFTGLVGLKPTRGRMPVGPGSGRDWQGASINFMLSRTVRDTAAMLDELQVFQPEAAFHAPLFPDKYLTAMKADMKKPLRIAFTTESPVGTSVSDHAKTAVRKVVHWLESEGHIVEEKTNDVDGVQLMKDYYMMNSGEMTMTVATMEAAFGREFTSDDMELEGWLLHVAGKSISGADFSRSLASWDVAAAKMAKLHETYDFYITPTTADVAPKIGQLAVIDEKKEQLLHDIKIANQAEQQQLIYDMFLPSLTYTPFGMLTNLTGQPAISLPVYVSNEGLPLGVQVIANKGEEHRLLQLAYQLEQTDHWIGMNGNPYFQ